MLRVCLFLVATANALLLPGLIHPLDVWMQQPAAVEKKTNTKTRRIDSFFRNNKDYK